MKFENLSRKSALVVTSFILIAGLAAGCATVMTGTTQLMTINSNIDGATLYMDGQEIGTTPFTGTVPKNKETLRVEKDGYRSETVALSKTLVPNFWGNIIIGGTLGSITDFATGAAYSYAPATYQVELRAEEQSSLDYQQQLVVRKFAMVYIDEIARDLGRDVGGPHLDGLVRLLRKCGNETASRGDVEPALTNSRGRPQAFGEHVVSMI